MFLFYSYVRDECGKCGVWARLHSCRRYISSTCDRIPNGAYKSSKSSRFLLAMHCGTGECVRRSANDSPGSLGRFWSRVTKKFQFNQQCIVRDEIHWLWQFGYNEQILAFKLVTINTYTLFIPDNKPAVTTGIPSQVKWLTFIISSLDQGVAMMCVFVQDVGVQLIFSLFFFSLSL